MKINGMIFMIRTLIRSWPFGNISFFWGNNQRNCARRDGTALYANLREYDRIANFREIQCRRSRDLTALTRLLVNQEGLLDKLRDYRDCRYERTGPAPRLMYVRLIRITAEFDARITYVQCVTINYRVRLGYNRKKIFFCTNKYVISSILRLDLY